MLRVVDVYVLPLITLSFALGIAVSKFLIIPPPLSLIIYPCITFLVARFIKNIHLETISLLLFALLTAVIHTQWNTRNYFDSSNSFVKIVDQKEYVILGYIDTIYSSSKDSTRMDLAARFIGCQENRLTEFDQTIKITVRGQIAPDYTPGDFIAVKTPLAHLKSPTTPGSFNYAEHLARQNIVLTGFLSSPYLITKAVPPDFIKGIPNRWTKRLRHTINLFLDKLFDNDSTGAIYKALLTGDKSSIPVPVKETFIRSGVMHLLAISGLHISLLAFILYTLFYWFLRQSEWIILHINTKKTAMLMTVPPLLLYSLLAGGNIPVIRAVIMSILVIAAICSNKRHSLAPIIAFAALIVLSISPDSLTSPSFQLSFAAIISIAYSLPIIQSILSRLDRRIRSDISKRVVTWLVSGICVSFAAVLGTAPLLLHHFNRISLVGIPATIVVEPLLCLWSLVSGITAIPFIFLAPDIAEILLLFGSYGIDLSSFIVSFFSSFSFSSIYLPAPHGSVTLLYYTFFFILLVIPPGKTLWKTMFSICFSLCILLSFYPPRFLLNRSDGSTTIAFLDIGHGSSTCLFLKNNKTILIDGGTLSRQDFDPGKNLIAPFLLSRGIQQIDDIIITHPDSDHYNGIPFLLSHFTVERLWISSAKKSSVCWNNLLKLAYSTKTEVIIPQAPTLVHNDDDSTLKILIDTAHTGINEYNEGLVLQFSEEPISILFPGDISGSTEKLLVDENLDIKSDILLATHHGSIHSNTHSFIQRVQPNIIIISSGKTRPSQLSPLKMKQRYPKKGVRILSLYDNGTVFLKINKGKYAIHTSLTQQ